MQNSDSENTAGKQEKAEKTTAILSVIVLCAMILVVIAAAAVFIIRNYTSGSADPELLVSQYFDSLPIITSDGSRLYLDSEPRTEEGKQLFDLLKNTWTYSIVGTETSGGDARVSVNITCPDLSKLQEPLNHKMLEEVQDRVHAASEKNEIYNSNDTYHDDVLQSAYDQALPQTCVAAPMITVNATMLLKRNFMEWELLNAAEPDSTLDAVAQSLQQSAKTSVPYISWTYVIADNASVPVPNPDAFLETTNPADVSRLLETTYARNLIKDQTLVWNEQIEFIEGSTMTAYLDESILMIQWQQLEQGTLGTFAEIFIADGSQLRRKIAGDTFGDMHFQTCSDFGKQTNSVLAVGGDFYNHGRNCGIVVYDREIYRQDYKTCDVCYITSKGDLLFSYREQFSEESQVRSFLDENDILWSLSFGPVLIDNGEIKTPDTYPWGEINDYYARSALGLLGEHHYLTMNLNCGDKYGYATLKDAGVAMKNHGCIMAYTLDGGQTATTAVNGVLKNPVQFGWEKQISDIIFFASAVPNEK